MTSLTFIVKPPSVSGLQGHGRASATIDFELDWPDVRRLSFCNKSPPKTVPPVAARATAGGQARRTRHAARERGLGRSTSPTGHFLDGAAHAPDRRRL